MIPNKLNQLTYYLFLFSAPLMVCTIIFSNLGSFLIILTFLIILAIRPIKEKIITDSYINSIIILFFLPMFLSLLSACITLSFRNDANYYEYFRLFLPLRLMNICIFFFIMLRFYSSFKGYSIDSLKKIMRGYNYSIFLILGLFGLWQILHNIFGIWIPNIETRSTLYFAQNLGIETGRITSLADEPSYLAPFLIDGAIISIYLQQYKYTLILIMICIFSLSFGGYINLFILLLAYLYLTKKRIRWSYLIIITISLIILYFIFQDIISLLVEIMSSRKEFTSDFEASDTSRTTMIIYPWQYLFQGNWLSIILGNGPSSFKYLHLSAIQPNGENFHTTSNNLFTDIAYEGGIFSFVCIIILFIRIWLILKKEETFTNIKEILTAKFLLIHLGISSFYRADYSSPRFIVILLIIGILYLIASNKKHDLSNYSYLRSK